MDGRFSAHCLDTVQRAELHVLVTEAWAILATPSLRLKTECEKACAFRRLGFGIELLLWLRNKMCFANL